MRQINEDIRQGSFKHSYLLYGEERYLRRQYRQKLQNALCGAGDSMNTHFYEGKDISVGGLIDLAETLPFLGERRVIFVSNSGLFKSGGEQLAEYLASPCETSFFVFTESEVDKRSKLYKTVNTKGYAAEFSVQDEKTLMRWIAGTLARDGKKITENTIRLLLSKTDTDMENIQMELEKLICYCMDREVVTEADVETVCTTRISSRIFDMINAIGDNRRSQALDLYYDLLALKEPPMRILFLIARQCNMLLQAKQLKASGCDSRAAGAKMGVAPFIASKYLNQAAKFSVPTLRTAVERCVDAEEAVKTGRMNDMMSVEILIMSVLQA